jgi:hypothetical protein
MRRGLQILRPVYRPWHVRVNDYATWAGIERDSDGLYQKGPGVVAVPLLLARAPVGLLLSYPFAWRGLLSYSSENHLLYIFGCIGPWRVDYAGMTDRGARRIWEHRDTVWARESNFLVVVPTERRHTSRHLEHDVIRLLPADL